MNIFKKLMRRVASNIPLLLSFLIPVIVMLLVFIQRGIYPFGDRCFLRTDLYHQYAPFFQEFCDKLKHGGSLFFSWDIGTSTNFLALFAYYLSSPTNFLLIFCPASRVIEFITYSIVLKIGLSGFTMGYYLKKHTGRNDFAIPMFTSFYALSGYMAAYSWNIMWLDCLVLFPLVILGLERLMKEDKCMLYCISLAFCIITNYYIAIMICIAVVLYFIMMLCTYSHKHCEGLVDEETGKPFVRTHYTNYPKKIGEFAIYSLIAGGLSAILLIPAYYALQMSASASSTFPKTFSSYFSILEMLQRHLDNVDVHLGLDHWPNIFCGIAVFVFVPLYIMNRKFSWKEKAGYLIMLLIFFASFSMNFLNFIWHGFHYPNSLPCRQSFIYVFLLIVMCYKGFMGLKERTYGQVSACIGGSVALVLLFEQMFAEEGKWNFQVYYVSILFLALYGILIYLYKKHKTWVVALTIIGLFSVLGENFMNTSMTSVTTVGRTDYTKFDEDYASLYDLAKKDSANELFFRCEKLKLRTKNDGSWYQYPSISVFSSTANAALSTYYKTLGMESATNAYSKTGATALIDMLFSVKYEFSNITYPDNEIRYLVGSSGDVKLYANRYTLPLGFMVPSDFETKWYTDGTNPVDTQNYFISAAANVYNPLAYVTYTDTDTSDSSAAFTVDEDGYYYAYILNSSIDEATTLITSSDGSHNDQSVTHTSLKRRFILDMGYAYAGDTITITSKTENQSLYFSLYRLDGDIMKKAYEKLSEQGLELTKFTDTVVEGTITALNDGLMYTSIGYDEGWTVYIDGVEATAINLKSAMLAVPLTEGTHTIKLVYVPQGFKTGLMLTLISLGALILLTLLRFLFRKYVHTPSAFTEDDEMDEEEAALFLERNAGKLVYSQFQGYEPEDEDEDDNEPEETETKATAEEDTQETEADEASLKTPAQQGFLTPDELEMVEKLEAVDSNNKPTFENEAIKKKQKKIHKSNKR